LVPASAPSGLYDYFVRLEYTWNQVLTYDHFQFEKLPLGEGEPILSWEIFNSNSTIENIGVEFNANNETTSLEVFPNPFNTETEISFHLPQEGYVTLSIFNILGREAVKLTEGWKSAGYYKITFNANAIASGIYFLRLQNNEQSLIRKIMSIK
jgi:hypothetical protein